LLTDELQVIMETNRIVVPSLTFSEHSLMWSDPYPIGAEPGAEETTA